MNKWKVMLSGAALAALLAGCGGQENQGQPEMQELGQEQQVSAGAGGASSNGGAIGQIGDRADFMGKVKSVDGQTITLYKSAMPTGGQRVRPEGTGAAPAAGADSEQPPVDGGGQPQAGERPQRPAGDAAPSDGGDRMNMDSMFTEETVEVVVTDATRIVSFTLENEKMVEKEMKLADLKADDIVSVILKEDSQEADTITLRTGGFFGGRGQAAQREQAATEAE